MVGFIRGLTSIWPYSVFFFLHITPAVLFLFDDRIIWPPASRMEHPSRQRHLACCCLGNTFLLNITMSHDVMICHGSYSWLCSRACDLLLLPLLLLLLLVLLLPLLLLPLLCLRCLLTSSLLSDYLAAAVLVIVGFSLPLWFLSSPCLLLPLLSLPDVALVLVLRKLLQRFCLQFDSKIETKWWCCLCWICFSNSQWQVSKAKLAIQRCKGNRGQSTLWTCPTACKPILVCWCDFNPFKPKGNDINEYKWYIHVQTIVQK